MKYYCVQHWRTGTHHYIQQGSSYCLGCFHAQDCKNGSIQVSPDKGAFICQAFGTDGATPNCPQCGLIKACKKAFLQKSFVEEGPSRVPDKAQESNPVRDKMEFMQRMFYVIGRKDPLYEIDIGDQRATKEGAEAARKECVKRLQKNYTPPAFQSLHDGVISEAARKSLHPKQLIEFKTIKNRNWNAEDHKGIDYSKLERQVMEYYFLDGYLKESEKLVKESEMAKKRSTLGLDTDWDSLSATRSRGYPIFDGVPMPEAPKSVLPRFFGTPVPDYATQSDNQTAPGEALDLCRKRTTMRSLQSDGELAHSLPEVAALREQIRELNGEIRKLGAEAKERGLVDQGGLNDWLDRPCGIPQRRSKKTKITL